MCIVNIEENIMFGNDYTVEKKHVYVEVELADELEKATSFETRRKIIDDLIESKKGHFKQEILQLDDDLALFTGAVIRFKDNLDKAISKQELEMDALLTRSEGLYDAVHERAKVITKQLEPVNKIIDGMSGKMDKFIKLCNDVPIYRVEEFINLVDKINELDDKRFNVLSKLMEINK